ncbi:lipopolysaccharide biosynthesis protein [Lactiplantibacillus plantarum]|uniref:lipopolysaccharide biosynthesis protein n=2 Tax=Lactiplantibacillus plantarum TaxID=1590 RepID=UPI00024F3ADC|nr:oligosaccharide flippase family protein [Lactiplantibacillus plantarum]EHS83615.1 polysaccharide biosynthesis protein, repeat unit transporternsporter [Lactiplantibacillus plantarum subsp. plantarum NC8]KFL88981.1 hypothetical protein LpDm1_1773 [Lactiplantibacillus plantarum]KZU15668.1 hypothetical protein CNW10_1717 [Lactiplantibacillus plantarum]MCT3233375.1 transporter [Lactiplantibacillus plantarum]MCT3550383.1 transporter [Lactiplantibacillus plantarum]
MHKNISRTNAAIMNSSIASIGQILTLIAQFVARTFFIHILGQEFLGLNGLFVNVLSFLNFAELGIGSAITYALYQPLADNDKAQVSALMLQFKKWYQYIALVVAVSGLIVTPFLPYFVHNQATQFVNIYAAFLLSLANTVASYLVSYKRTLLIANQQGYMNTINTVGFSLMQQVLQVILLVIIPSYYLYLIVQLIFMIASNFRISHVVDRYYPYLKDYPHEKVSKRTMHFFKKNVVGMLSAKIGGIVVNGTDNIVLSFFVGLSAVGLYSNYTLILTGLTNVINQAVQAVSSSVGNLAAVKGTSERQKNVFYKYYSLSNFLVLCATVGFTAFSSTFIRYWVGAQYVYTQLPLFLIAFNFYLQGVRQPIITYTNAYGLYWYERYKPIFESLVNLLVSVLLISTTRLEVSAVLLGTIASNILVNLWWEPLIVFKWGLHAKMMKFMILNIVYVAFGGVIIAGIVYSTIIIDYNNIILNILTTVVFEIIAAGLYLVITKTFAPVTINLSSLMAGVKKFKK